MSQMSTAWEHEARLRKEFGTKVQIESVPCGDGETVYRIMLLDKEGLCVGLGIGTSIEKAEAWMREQRARVQP